MSRHDDDLDGEELLTPRQRAVVDRFRGRRGRYQRDRVEPTTQQAWADFTIAADADEKDRYWNS